MTNKSREDQIRILKDYVNRRKQHSGQGEFTLEQVVKRFKINFLNNDRQKTAYFKRLIKHLEENN
ncbi:MAG: hypothetical protein ABI550_01370 [Ignavibacteriaceae bacterium]